MTPRLTCRRCSLPLDFGIVSLEFGEIISGSAMCTGCIERASEPSDLNDDDVEREEAIANDDNFGNAVTLPPSSVDEARPRADETLRAWIARIEPTLAVALSEDHRSADPHAAYRLGCAVGTWAVLHRAFDALRRGERDAAWLLGCVLAGEIAVSHRRGVVSDVDDLLRDLGFDSREGGSDGR